MTMSPTWQKKVAAGTSVLSNSVLIVLKIVAGILAGSISIISEAIHSGIDLIASIAATFAVSRSDAPADDEHPYGHGKWENVSGFFEAILILGAAVWIISEVVHRLLEPKPVEMLGWGIVVMLISSVANTLVGTYLLRVSKKTDSVALRADAWHLLTDVYTSLGVMCGLGIIWIGGILFPAVDLEWLDPIIAMGVALLIMKAGWKLAVESVRDLLDARLGKDEEDWIREYIHKFHPVVHGAHNLRTRRAGTIRFLEFHLIVDANMSVKDSHDISERMEQEIAEKMPGAMVSIHVEPCDGACKQVCLKGCFLTVDQREKVKEAYQAAR